MSVQRRALGGEGSQLELLAISRPRPSVAHAGIFRRTWTMLVLCYQTLDFDDRVTELRFRKQYRPLPAGKSLAHHRAPPARGQRFARIVPFVPA